MTSRLELLVARREALVARSRARRDELGTTTARLRGEIGWLETLVGAARAIQRPGALVGAAALALAIVGPARILRFLPLAVRFAPVAMSVYRSIRPGKRREA